ncbi:MAG: polysaccharide biosynthesis/export family protein [Steroidobacteraceae bacterium]|nr:polysaccharide biosynthesis/export family protein [Steroidobacteraceae bacterium]
MGRLVLFLSAVLLLGGCAFAPGMTMSAKFQRPVVSGEGGGIARAEYVPITPALIAKLEQKRANVTAIQELSAATPGPYRIGPRDVLSVVVWEHPELTIPFGEYRAADSAGQVVDEEGYMYYPYVGRVRVSGMTTGEVRELLTSRLSTYIEQPQVDVRVAAYRSQRVNIVGEVAQPGVQPISDVPLTVAELISRSGGLTERADLRHVALTREGHTVTLDLLAMYKQGDAAQNLLLKGGDVLYIPSSEENKVYLMGEVPHPQAAPMIRGRMSLAEALSVSGGLNQNTADPEQVYVIRRNGIAPASVFHLDASSADALLLADAFELQPRDIVFVGTAGVTRWNRVVSQVLPSALLLESSRDAGRP